MEQTLPQMMEEKQTARLLAVSTAALRKWRREGRGPQFTRIGRCVRYELSAIQRFITANSSAGKAGN